MRCWLLRRDVLWTAGLLTLLVAYLAFGDAADPCVDDPASPAAAAGYGDSALAPDERVIVAGTVTGTFLGDDALDGFFLQAADARGDPAALFVYAPGLNDAERRRVRRGARLQVRGTTDRFHGRPQIGRVEAVHQCGGGGRPEPVVLEGAPDRGKGSRMEGLLVRYPGELVVTGNQRLGRFGTLALAPERLVRRRSGQHPEDVLLLDDGSYGTHPDPVPYLDPGSGTRRAGDRVRGVTGILTHAFDRWRIHPVMPPSFRAANPRPRRPGAVGGDLRAAAFNVQNYFLTTGERGAADRQARARQRRRLRAALAGLDADLLALAEVENDARALADLVGGAAPAADGGAYRVVRGGDPGGDAIRAGLVYRPQRLELLAGPFRDGAPVHDRPPQAAVFRPPGGRAFLAAAVHFKSKTRCPGQGDVDTGQGCWNQRRTDQARALVDFVRERARRHDVDDILLLGDFNSYPGEAPMRVLAEAGFADLVGGHADAGAGYTYVYREAAGRLDYALANDSMRRRVRGAAAWHINADEPAALAYDGRMAAGGGALRSPFRSSDHDPVVVGFESGGD